MERTGWGIFPAPQVNVRARPDGAFEVQNLLGIPPVFGTVLDRLDHWASHCPDRIFLSEIRGDRRHTITYAQFVDRVAACAARLLAADLAVDRPIAICGNNGINHAIMLHAAMSVGVPTAIISPAYVAPSATPWAKLHRVLEEISPALLLADSAEGMMQAIAQTPHATRVEALLDLGWLDALPAVPPGALAQARANIGLDTVAKLLFTSGSTQAPKAVINTHRMMASNMMGFGEVWPFLKDEPPVLVDWLPWNHTFGGNCCFNIALWFGGTMHIDMGKPLPGQIALTEQAIRQLEPTIYFNVPAGYEALLPVLEADEAFAAAFLGRVKFLFNAGAAMPQSLRARIEGIAQRVIGRPVPIVGGWGSTETAPCSTVLYFPTAHSANLGVPLPGVEIKMVPAAGRYELLVRGPNVMPGYWRNEAQTRDAFDEEGFYRIGDAGRWVDIDDPSAGIAFDGRMAENFKLLSGTWVNVGALRLAVIAACHPLVADAVITGEQRDDIGALLVPSQDTADLSRHEVAGKIAELLELHNARQSGNSTRIARFHVLETPPDRNRDETTDKGYINQRAMLSNRRDQVEALYEDDPAEGYYRLR